MKNAVLKCSETCHNGYHKEIAAYTADQIVALSESAVSKHTHYQQQE